MNCPICNKELQLTDTYCPECGFEMHIYPEPLSPELKSYEEERVNKYKEQRTQKEKELKKQEDAFDEVSSQLSEARDTLKKKEEELKTAETDARANKHRIAELEKEIKTLNATPEQEPLAGYLVLKENSEDKIVGVLNIFFGVNYFGKKPSNHENAHSERISVKCKGLCEEHFSIEVTDKEVIGKLLEGDWIIGLSNHDSSITLEHRDGFKIDNLTFTFIEK